MVFFDRSQVRAGHAVCNWREGVMAVGKVLQFPMRNPNLFSREINDQVLSHSEFNRVLNAAIRALPHVENSHCREELKRALCDLLLGEIA